MRRASSAHWLLALALGLLLVPPRAARASAGYPAEIQKQLALSSPPACSICHAGGDTDAGTVTTAFGTTMVSRGLMGGDNLPSLDGALAALEGEMSPYIADLKEGLDPNNPNAGGVAPITYGCLEVTGQGAGSSVAFLAVLGLALLLLLRPRRARR